MQDIVQQKKTEEEEEVLQSYYAMGKVRLEGIASFLSIGNHGQLCVPSEAVRHGWKQAQAKIC